MRGSNELMQRALERLTIAGYFCIVACLHDVFCGVGRQRVVGCFGEEKLGLRALAVVFVNPEPVLGLGLKIGDAAGVYRLIFNDGRALIVDALLAGSVDRVWRGVVSIGGV